MPKHMFSERAAKKARLAANLPKTRRQLPKHKVVEPGLIEYNNNVEKLAAQSNAPAANDNQDKARGTGGRRTRRRTIKVIRMKKSEYLREHHHLFKVLRNPTRRALNAELRKQQRELRERGLKG
jgi:hypothetical protein